MINNIICLCLDKRKELWQDLEQQCLSKGWKFHKFIVGDGQDTSLVYNHIDKLNIHPHWIWGTGVSAERHYRAFESHKAIIKYAIKKHIDNFLLLEDDAYITSRFDDCYNQIDDINNFDWNLIYLGWHAFEFEGDMAIGRNLEIEEKYKRDKLSELIPAVQCGGFHGVLINKNIYNTLLNLRPIAPMDCQCNSLPIKRYMITPKIIHVKSAYSQCEDKFVEREIV